MSGDPHGSRSGTSGAEGVAVDLVGPGLVLAAGAAEGVDGLTDLDVVEADVGLNTPLEITTSAQPSSTGSDSASPSRNSTLSTPSHRATAEVKGVPSVYEYTAGGALVFNYRRPGSVGAGYGSHHGAGEPATRR